MVRKTFAMLGASGLERVVRILLLATIFLLPFEAPLIISEARATIAGAHNPFAVPAVYPVEAVMLAAAAGWWWLRRPPWRLLFPYRWLIAVIVIAALSTQWASYPLLAAIGAVHIAIALLWLIVLAEELRDRAFTAAAAWTFITAAALQSGLGITQYFLGHDVGLHRLGEPVVSTTMTGVAKLSAHGEKYLRAYGTLPHPNVLAAYLVSAIFLVGTMLFWPLRKSRGRIWLLAGLQVFLGAGLLVTFSRVALAITVVNGALVALYSFRRWKRLPLAAGLAAAGFFVVAALLIPELGSRTSIESTQETGLTNREVGYELAGSMVSDRPAGVGTGNFVAAAPELRDDLPAYQYQPVHNALVLIAAELGAIAAFLVLAWLVRLGWLFHRLRPKDRRVNTSNFSIFCLSGAFIAMGMTDHFFWSLPQGLWLASLLAAVVISRIPRPVFEGVRKRPRRQVS